MRTTTDRFLHNINAGIPPWMGIIIWLIPTFAVCWLAIKATVVAKAKRALAFVMLIPALAWSLVSASQFLQFFQSYNDALQDIMVSLLMISMALSAAIPFFLAIFIFNDLRRKK